MGLLSCTPETPNEDTDTGNTYPFEVHQLELLWCPNEKEVSWDLWFGLDAPGFNETNPPEWLGSSTIQMGGSGLGFGAGRGAHMCGCSHGVCPCELEQEQEFARTWRIWGTRPTHIPIEQLEYFDVGIWEKPVQQPDGFNGSERVLNVRFEVFPPLETQSIGCLTLPVEETTR